MRIVDRIPQVRVDAVQDAAQIRRTFAQHAVEAAAEFRRGDFTCVGRTDRADASTEHDAGFHE